MSDWLPWIWLAVAVALGVLELATGTFMLLLFAVAAAICAIAAWAGVGVLGQSILFLLGTIASIACAPALVKRVGKLSPTDARFGVDALIDEFAYVIEGIDPVTGKGLVKVGTDTWRARAEVPIAAGERVRVAEVTGTRLVVYPAPLAGESGRRMTGATEESTEVSADN